ncbi:MAG: ferrous iron transporter B [Vicinamibacterales bacterium]
MSCHVVHEHATSDRRMLRLRAHPLRVALVGNPNVGKSVVFGALTGRYATVSNYPGTTVSVTKGRALVGAEVCDLVDTPGVNALNGAISEDERITRDVLERGEADLIIQVADARNIRRALMLSAEIAAYRRPVILALNMVDEALARGIAVNAPALAHELGVPVIEMVATEGRGLQALRDSLPDAVPMQVPPMRDAAARAAWAHGVTAQVRTVSTLSLAYAQEALSRATRSPITGIPILAAVLYAMYLFVGVFGAQTLVGLMENEVFGRFVNPAATWLVDRALPFAVAHDFFVGEYGVVTMGLTYAIAIVLPVVTTFFLLFGFLEDSGYIPRLAVFSDRIFRTMGLNGKAVLPMVLGLGCDTMATMTTRILATPKERLIAILLLALGIPCSAQLATILGILGGVSFAAVLTLFGVVLTQMFFVGWLAGQLLRGDRSDFIMELPPIRLPKLGNLLRKTWMRVWWYLGEAVPLFLVGTVLLFALDRMQVLGSIAAAGRPVVTGMLGLPPETARILMMGFLRRDYGAAGLFQLAQSGHLSGVQAVVALTVMTLFIPCVANFLMIVKERGLRVATTLLGVITPIAILTGTVLHYVFDAFGVRF